MTDTQHRAPREYPIFRPYWHQRPVELLARQFLSDDELDWIRVAKDQDSVIAAYEIKRNDQWNFSIQTVVVVPRYRKRGLGRWMLLHALGLIESSGGRVVHLRCPQGTNFITELGFRLVEQDHYTMHLEQE